MREGLNRPRNRPAGCFSHQYCSEGVGGLRGMGTFAGNSSVDAQALAVRMHSPTFWLDSRENHAVERHAFDFAPFGRSHISIDPTSVAPTAV